MARIPSLVWAVPMTLALLVLAKGALQRIGSPPPPNRVAPALVERLEPPGRLHAPDDARPVTAAPQPAAAPTIESAIGPAATAQVPPTVPERRVPSQVVAASAPKPEQPLPISYPVAEGGDLPQMADSFPGIDKVGSQVRASAAARPRLAEGTTFQAAASPVSEQAMAAVRQQVAGMNQKAVKLAQRGALYSARAELLDALRLIAQTHDAQSGTAERTKALGAAITAMEESDDFTSAAAGGGIGTADIIRPHQTPVLKRLDVSRLTPLTCSQHYYTYAQQRLSEAIGGQAVAANSLSLLGMVHGHLAGEAAGLKSSHSARAMVFHQAALAIDPRHYRSANELGVLWARCGELTAARKVLITSLQSHPTASAWHNLAAVHDRLGERELAQLAKKEATLLSPKTPNEIGPSVEWVDAATFAAKSPAQDAGKAVQVSAASAAGSHGAAWR